MHLKKWVWCLIGCGKANGMSKINSSRSKGLKKKRWTTSSIKEEASKYNKKANFQKYSNAAYLSAKRKGILDEVCSHMQQKNYYKYTVEELTKIAFLYTTRTEFQKKNKQAYTQSRELGVDFFNAICSHMYSVRKVQKHTKETAAADALKYKTRREFCVNDAGSYLAAVKNGWIDEICEHMQPAPKGGSSKEEKRILSIVNEHFPDAIKKIFYNKSYKFRQSRYELDIFIPSLNKGIEYDGTYWHSTEVLAKNKKISLEEAANYHEEKDSFFKSIGIEVLHIKEDFWKAQEIWQTRTILSFLNILPMPPAHKFFRLHWAQNLDENGEF